MDGATTKAEVIVTFLAVLELMKLNQFVIRQSHLLGDIEVERRTVSAPSSDSESAETFAETDG